jgi:hypothetical protein
MIRSGGCLMHYPDGQEIRLGDRMAIWDGSEATVVCSIDTEEYSPDYPREHWAYLGEGILIDSVKLGRVHSAVAEGEMRLLARSTT